MEWGLSVEQVHTRTRGSVGESDVLKRKGKSK